MTKIKVHICKEGLNLIEGIIFQFFDNAKVAQRS